MSKQETPGRCFCNLLVVFALLFALPSPGVQADPVKQVTEEETFFRESYLLLTAKDYRQLDQKFQEYLDLYAGNKISAEDLADKYDVFSKMPSLEPRFDEWIKLFPESYSARLARGIYRVTDAWEKRGSAFSRNTTDERLRGFSEILKDAQSDLLLSIPLYARPVDSYRYLIRVAKGLSLGIERNLLDSALTLDPKAYRVRFEYVDAIAPKWGGSFKMMKNFLEECQKSRMSDKDKKGIEGKYFYTLGQQATFDKDYKTASTYYYKYYLTNNKPENLQLSGQTAFDGGFKNLAFERFDELVKEHPEYRYGYELRGLLYETELQEPAKAVQDFIAGADLGAQWAQNRMGWYYMMGISVPVDYEKAKHYLELSAKQGNGNAMGNLVTLEQLQKRPK